MKNTVATDAMTSSSVTTMLSNSDGRDDFIIPIASVLPSSDIHGDIMMSVATVIHL
jgi:hypothetical protein